MNISRSAGGIIINEKLPNKIVLVKNKGKSCTFPKGHQEKGEDLLSTAKREIYEETGIKDLENLKAFGSYERPKKIIHDGKVYLKIKIISLYLFRTSQIELNPIDQDNPSAFWVDKEEAWSQLTYKEDREFYKKVLRSL